ncbi:LacI family DNA-binding transcriptional regulator [Phaeacidiphilus oryzae]|uniref:LacI family DNA-binding transcriptional regulator n=1 Tax=Phaeacidiphilus oryzae TaxID=348818 RepID=UPI00055E1802|nr:LacI family DNA-binding transcriptional regulator [Phaeacidiphilus oryzae]
MREPVAKRQERVLAAVRSRGTARIADLAEELGVSVVTVRRDAEELATSGRLRRGHGVVHSLECVPEPEPEPRPVPGRRTGPGSASAPDAHAEGVLAMVIPENHRYLTATVQGARRTAAEAGLRLRLHLVSDEAGAEQAAEQAAVRQALAAGPRGLLLTPHWRTPAEAVSDKAPAWHAELDVPTVLVERRPERWSPLYALDSVRSDHGYGVQLALDHLLMLGHRRIVLAARDDSPSARYIRSAFTESTIRLGLADGCQVISSVPGPSGPEAPTAPAGGRRVDLARVVRESGATAVLIHNDSDALMLLPQLQEAGIDVPRDCSVVTYDDVVADLGPLPLTAVAPPKAELGRVAAELLIRRAAAAAAGARPEPARHTELLPSLVLRESTAPAPTR